MKEIFKTKIQSFVIVIILMLAVGYTDAFSAETSEEKSVIVFVDEASGELVVTNHVNSVYVIQLFDLTGKEVLKVVQERDIPTRRIQTSQFRKGIYLVRITPASDATSVTLKVMIR